MSKTKQRHMVQVSHEAYEKLRQQAFNNRRTLTAELDLIIGV